MGLATMGGLAALRRIDTRRSRGVGKTLLWSAVRKLGLIGVAATVVTATAPGAQAYEKYTFSGSTEYLQDYFSSPPKNGDYYIQFKSSVPIQSSPDAPNVTYYYNVEYFFYDDSGYLYSYGDENETESVQIPNGVLDYRTIASFDVPSDSTSTSSDFYFTPLGVQYEFAFASDPNTGDPIPGNFTFSMSSVPEPAAWSMLLFGFGGAGWALRRSRSAKTVA